jgi:serine/threonine protein kinase
LCDETPVPKVIDFGLAKATGQALTDHSISTALGAVVGTPQYMSPEQATLNNLDTRSSQVRGRAKFKSGIRKHFRNEADSPPRIEVTIAFVCGMPKPVNRFPCESPRTGHC